MYWCDFEVSYFDKLLRGGEAADAQGQQDPAAGVAALGRILRELFADLTVDLVPEAERERQQLNKSRSTSMSARVSWFRAKTKTLNE